jgi:glycerophosphoryl diester phosphodiesterase
MIRKILSIIIPMMIIQTAGAQVKIIAHRGASYLAPENTVAAAKLAWKNMADAVECDIYLSKDNRIICLHDATTKRTTGQDYRISETESAVLRKLDAGSFKDPKYKSEKLPFLHELIRTVPRGKELVVELKCGPEVLPILKETVERNRKGKTYSFICFNINTIIETKKYFPDDCCYWLCSRTDQLETGMAQAAEAGLDGISLSFSIISAEVMREAREKGLDVYSWTVDDPAEAKRLLSLGVKGITTNRPGWLNEQIFGQNK